MARVARDVNAPRRCVRCKRIQAAIEFYPKVRNEDGSIRTRQSSCRTCVNNRRRADRQERGERQSREEINRKARERYSRYRLDPEKAERMRKQAREGARRRRERAKRDAAIRESIQAAQRRWYEKLYADPERHADYLVTIRIYGRSRRDSGRIIASVPDAYRHDRTLVASGPFLAYLAEAFPGESPEQLEKRIGLAARTLREIDSRNGVGLVELETVDNAFTRGLGRPDLVAALYPIETT